MKKVIIRIGVKCMYILFIYENLHVLGINTFFFNLQKIGTLVVLGT
jgi:hypothetical protein